MSAATAAVDVPTAWYRIVQAYQYDPRTPYAAGQHRGVTVTTTDGFVRSLVEGRVVWSGSVARREVVVVLTRDAHGRALRSTYVGMDARSVTRGAIVHRGDVVGHARGHAVTMGVRVDGQHNGYVPIAAATSVWPAAVAPVRAHPSSIADAVIARMISAMDGDAAAGRVPAASVARHAMRLPDLRLEAAQLAWAGHSTNMLAHGEVHARNLTVGTGSSRAGDVRGGGVHVGGHGGWVAPWRAGGAASSGGSTAFAEGANRSLEHAAVANGRNVPSRSTGSDRAASTNSIHGREGMVDAMQLQSRSHGWGRPSRVQASAQTDDAREARVGHDGRLASVVHPHAPMMLLMICAAAVIFLMMIARVLVRLTMNRGGDATVEPDRMLLSEPDVFDLDARHVIGHNREPVAGSMPSAIEK